MANKETYKCGICGSEYKHIQERMECELSCFEKQKEQARKVAEEKAAAEKKSRQAEVDAAIAKAENLLEKFIKDYGSYQYKCDDPSARFYDYIKFWF